MCSPERTPTRSTASRSPAPTVDKSPNKQAERERLIKRLIAEDVIYKVDTGGGSLPKMYVQPRFYSLTIDEKKAFASVVYAYYFDGSDMTDTVIIRDARNGKDVGSYNPHIRGLEMK
jgi:hypothetical protein